MEYNIWPWTYRGDWRSFFFKLQIAFGKLIEKLSSIITVNSPSIKTGMTSHGIDPLKVFLIPTGIDSRSLFTENIPRSASGGLQVLYAGRLVEERGADQLIELITRVLKVHKNVSFKIVGGGSLLQAIRSFVKENHLVNEVEVFGQLERTRVIDIMRQSDIALFISKNENYGSLALLECMAVGCPVIATNIGSTSKLVIDKYNGILVKPDVNSIAKAIIMLNNQHTLLNQMRVNCRRTAKDYDWEVVSARFIKLLERISINKQFK